MGLIFSICPFILFALTKIQSPCNLITWWKIFTRSFCTKHFYKMLSTFVFNNFCILNSCYWSLHNNNFILKPSLPLILSLSSFSPSPIQLTTQIWLFCFRFLQVFTNSFRVSPWKWCTGLFMTLPLHSCPALPPATASFFPCCSNAELHSVLWK